MLGPGEYEDTFRALGRFLEQLGAAQVQVRDLGAVLEVSWRGHGGERERREFDALSVAGVRGLAGAFRNTQPPATIGFGASELLRMLGHELDELKVERVRFAETVVGFDTHGTVAGQPFDRNFHYGDLVWSIVSLRAKRT